MKKILCICLALLLVMSGVVLAEEDLQAQLDAANARIAELEGEVEKYYPFYQAQIAATYGTDGVIWVSDIVEQYDAVNMQYQSMGISLDQLGADAISGIKMDLVQGAVENEVKLQKAAELGLDQFTDDQLAQMKTSAEEEFEGYVHYYIDYFYPEQDVTDEMHAEAEAYWTSVDVSAEVILEQIKDSTILSEVDNYLCANVEVSDEEVKAYYEAKIEQNKEEYANDRTYNSDRNAAMTIAWNPEGYRAVKHVLVLFNDEQSNKYIELNQKLSELEDEKTAEPTEDFTPRDAAEIDSDIDDVNAQLDALYAEIMPKAEEVVAAFEGGADFNALIEQYGEDPGMRNEPTASQGYAVSANCTAYDPAFASAAMSIAEKGGISAPTPGSYGIYIVWYMDDVPAGEVPFEQIAEAITAEALSAKTDEVRAQRLDAWIESMNVQYYYENLDL